MPPGAGICPPAIAIDPVSRAASDPVTIMDAPACRCGIAAFSVLSTPPKFTALTSDQACSGCSLAMAQMPALATTTSRWPNSAMPRATASRSAPYSRTSACTAIARRSSASISLTVCARSSGVDIG